MVTANLLQGNHTPSYTGIPSIVFIPPAIGRVSLLEEGRKQQAHPLGSPWSLAGAMANAVAPRTCYGSIILAAATPGLGDVRNPPRIPCRYRL